MAITTSKPPVGGNTALTAAVEHLMGPTDSGAPVAGANPREAAQPVPLFSVRLENAADDQFMYHAQPTGWRYLIFGNGPLAIADVREKVRGAPPVFSQLIRGALAERMAQAVELAAHEYQDASESYEARVLEVPALPVVAFWLHGVRDVFYPLLLGPDVAKLKVQEDTSFVAKVTALAKVRLERQQIDRLQPR